MRLMLFLRTLLLGLSFLSLASAVHTGRFLRSPLRTSHGAALESADDPLKFVSGPFCCYCKRGEIILDFMQPMDAPDEAAARDSCQNECLDRDPEVTHFKIEPGKCRSQEEVDEANERILAAMKKEEEEKKKEAEPGSPETPPLAASKVGEEEPEPPEGPGEIAAKVGGEEPPEGPDEISAAKVGGEEPEPPEGPGEIAAKVGGEEPPAETQYCCYCAPPGMTTTNHADMPSSGDEEVDTNSCMDFCKADTAKHIRVVPDLSCKQVDLSQKTITEMKGSPKFRAKAEALEEPEPKPNKPAEEPTEEPVGAPAGAAAGGAAGAEEEPAAGGKDYCCFCREGPKAGHFERLTSRSRYDAMHKCINDICDAKGLDDVVFLGGQQCDAMTQGKTFMRELEKRKGQAQ